MNTKELEAYLWDAANILRGMIDAADFKQYIFPLLFFKRLSDLWDEEYQQALEEGDGDLTYAEFAENHRFQIPNDCHWEDVRKKTMDVGSHLQNALNGIEQANFELLHEVFGDAQWTNKRRLSDEKLLDLIEHFSKYKLTVSEVPHDIMGEGYEYLIKKFADDSGHTAAEFYTNRTVVKLMTQITDPESNESIYDPTCGSGGFALLGLVVPYQYAGSTCLQCGSRRQPGFPQAHHADALSSKSEDRNHLRSYLNFNVASPAIARIIAMIQNRMTIVDSAQPFSS